MAGCVTRVLLKVVGWVMLTVLLLLLLVIVSFVLVARTEQGSAWLINTAVSRFVAEGRVGSVSGSLTRGLGIDDFGGAFGDTAVALRRAEVKLEWKTLLRSRLQLNYLRVDGLIVEIPASTDELPPEPPVEQPPGAWPSLMLPVDIHLGQLQLTDTLIRFGEEEHQIHYLGLVVSLNLMRLEIEELHVQYEDIDASLSGQVATRFPYASNLRIGWLFNAEEPWSGRALINGDLQTLDLEHRLTGQAVVDTRGTIATSLTADTMAFDLEAMEGQLYNRVRLADFPLEALDETLDAVARVDISGSAQRWLLEIEANAELGDYPALVLDAAGAGNLERFDLEHLTLSDGSGQLQADGSVNWVPDLLGQLQIAIDSLDLSPWVPDAELILDGRLALAFEQVDGESSATVSLQPLQVGYDDLQLDASGNLAWTPERITVDDLLLVAEGNRLELSGSLIETALDAQWRLDASQLTALGEEFSGHLTSTGRVTGTLDQPNAQIDLQGRNVTVPGLAIESLSFTAVPQGQGPDHQIDFAVANLSAGDTRVDGIEANLSGQLERHHLTIAALMGEDSVSLELSGGYRESSWRGQFESILVAQAELGEWRTRETAAAEFSAETMKLETLCLWQEDSSLCVDVEGGADRDLQLGGALDHFPLHRFNEYWPVGAGIQGWLEGKALVSLTDDGPVWEASILSPLGHLLYAELANELETFPYSNLHLNSRGDARQWQVDGGFVVEEQGELSFDVTLDPEANNRLNGAVSGRFTDLSWLDMFANPVSDIAGELVANFRISGVLDQPELEGAVTLDQFTAYVAPLDIRLEDGRLDGRFNRSGLWKIDGGIRSGEGVLNLESTIDISDPEAWQVQFTTAGARLLLIDTPEIRSLASPEIRGRLTPERGIINGRIGLLETRVRLVELPAGQESIVISDDEVIYSTEEVDAAPPYDLIANVEVVIEDEIDFEGYGLSARADGRITAHYRTDRPLTAEGRFALIEGRYRAYGQNLNIERGEVYFNGPLDNPAIDIRAARTVRDVTAGIQLGGRVQSLTSSIYSDPPMSPSDAMAFLLTGRPLSGASQEEANMLINAVASLGIEHSEMITGGIQSAFGLDTFALEGGDTLQDTALVVGKNLTPKLLISYSEKLFERTSSVLLSYELTRRTTVQAESGEGQSVDIIFTDEFGQ